MYGLSNYDKYAVSYFTEGSTNFIKIEIYVNGVLPKLGGYLATLSEDSFTSGGVAQLKNISSQWDT
jgi:hypothetical protein